MMNAGDDSGNGICRLPNDVLVEILRLLPERSRAKSRCVCRAWRAIIKTHSLVRSLPWYFPRRAFSGIFFTMTGCSSRTSFFAPQDSRRRIFYLDDAKVRQSCNGLLLLEDWYDYYVLNPVTARCARLPQPWSVGAMTLAFDPAVSLHYDVFLLQEETLARPKQGEVSKKKVVPLLVYSSCTRRWENREFVPGRCAPGHLYDAVATTPQDDDTVWSSDYWNGSLYMHCHNNILMVLRPSHGTYDMVQLPGEPASSKWWYMLPRKSVLASYERGIHYVQIKSLQLRVWMLIESTHGQLGWTLAYDANLNPHGHSIQPAIVKPMIPWGIVESSGEPVKWTKDDDYGDANGDDSGDDDDDDDDEEEEEDGYCYVSWKSHGKDYGSWNSHGKGYGLWNSDEDNFIDVGEASRLLGPPTRGVDCSIVGFHPHLNALILIIDFAVVVYHLDTSKMQYLGNYYELLSDPVQQACCVDGSFTYRPCYGDVLPTLWKLSLTYYS